jgi:hypothetical protein
LRLIEVAVSGEAGLSNAERIIEKCCSSEGLQVSVKTSLRMRGDNVHWHFKKGEEKGTLEVTLLREERRVLISVHDNRRGAWIGASIKRLKPAIERRLSSE